MLTGTRGILTVGSFAVALILIAAGCDSETPATPPSATATSGPTTPSKRATAEAQAIAAYNALWQAMAKAGEIPDPDAPELRQHATGDALARVVRTLVFDRENGLVTRGAPVTSPSVVSATPADDPTELNLVDCGDSTNWTTHKKSNGAQISPDPRGRRHITAVVTLTGGVWKVSSFNVGEIGSCD
jgi:hypothetical protein